MQRLVSHPEEQRKLQQASNKKAEQGARLFRVLPDEFVFGYVGRQENLFQVCDGGRLTVGKTRDTVRSETSIPSFRNWP
jgi:hypothetical protein